jgi:hypothetical protein
MGHATCTERGRRSRDRVAKENIMTKRFLSILSAASLVAVLTPFSVSTSAAEVTCRVPFSFAVNGTMLPAGRYIVSTERNTLKISGFSHGVFVLGIPMESRTETDARLVFDKYGDQYSLRQVWMGGRSGRELPVSSRDRDRSKAARSGQSEQVVIPAL